ncbi:MAG: hypothetical protein HQK63_17715 [Desulfamplus sp.]|nr:hypothetical protein [Desulfamplus sp.]
MKKEQKSRVNLKNGDSNKSDRAGVNVKLISEDPTYGYSEKNPIRVGGRDEYEGPKAERAYLDSLVDSTGKSVKYQRLGSRLVNGEDKPLDHYEITLSNKDKFELWIDMYKFDNKPEDQPAPVGLLRFPIYSIT